MEIEEIYRMWKEMTTEPSPFPICCRGEGKADCKYMIWTDINSPTYCTRNASHSNHQSERVVYQYCVNVPSKAFPSIKRKKLAINDIGEDEDGFTRIDFELRDGDIIQVVRNQEEKP